ncbi:MAG: hypothetical protein WBA61_02760 [Aequorivita sp.]
MKHSKRKYNLERLQSNQLFDLARFVVSENFKKHTNETYPKEYETEINHIFREELNYFENAQVFVFKDSSNTIVGSIRVLRWNYIDVLPIQKIFNIDSSVICVKSCSSPIWHIGRFAIHEGIRDVGLFKQLIICALSPICKDESSIAYAECDSKLLRILLVLGIKAQPIGDSINYLGSETVPIKITHSGLIDFYRKNQVLVPIDFLNLSHGMSKNYTFV